MLVLRKPLLLATFCLLIVHQSGLAQNKPRARDLGIPFDGIPGHLTGLPDSYQLIRNRRAAQH